MSWPSSMVISVVGKSLHISLLENVAVCIGDESLTNTGPKSDMSVSFNIVGCALMRCATQIVTNTQAWI